MGEELQKRNTDCVYFLASPLTCKKGSECEYRHSEMARLNPRDCWYWLSGSCLNPSCAFRHPPLDAGQTETAAPETAPNVSAVSVNKTNVPCYYFYNGFCNKGELCTFLHGPVPINNVHPQKASNARANPDGPPVEKKGSAGSDTGSAPRISLSKSFQTGQQQTTRRPVMGKESDSEFRQPSPQKVGKRSASFSTPSSPYEDAAADSSISPVEATDSVPRSPHASSPGFDVLVDNGSDEMVYEDDYNYVIDHNGDSGEPVGDEYDLKDNARDDPEYADSRIFYEKERRDYDYHYGAEHSLDRVTEGPPESRRSVLDRVVPARRHSPSKHAYNGRNSVDLRDRIKRRRMTDDRSDNAYSGMRESSHHISRSRDRPRYQSQHNVRRSMEVDNFGSRTGHEGRFTRPSFDRSRLQEKPQLSSKVSGNPTTRKRNYDEESTVFKGPKSLAQIKDEKMRTRGSRESSESFLDGLLEDNFVAPKTLSEILEEKRKLGSQVNGNTDNN